jgi:hypothetical protein
MIARRDVYFSPNNTEIRRIAASSAYARAQELKGAGLNKVFAISLPRVHGRKGATPRLGTLFRTRFMDT